jgi:1,4-dihydroxy-2-naphthoyl-CoA synthase
MACGEDHAHGALHADLARQALQAAGECGKADARLGQCKGRVLRGDDEVAGQRNLEAAAHGNAVHRGDDRLVAIAGGLQRLPRQIGMKRAMGIILTARHVKPQEGYELGFVNEVVPQGEALNAALRWAETICQNSPMSIRASKQAIQKGMAVSLEQAITEQREYPAVKAMAASEDYVEGPKAFSEKRKPNWKGK